jgi:HPr kinase/phosphorylase
MTQPPFSRATRLTVQRFYDDYRQWLQLELVAGAAGLRRQIREKSLNRPALALTGYYRYFANKRVQLFGAGEMSYLRDQTTAEQAAIMETMLSRHVPCIVISRGLLPTRAMREACEAAGVPLFRTAKKSKDFSVEAAYLLDAFFAPKTTLHGTLVDIRGVGCLIQGKSGVGKSECALALIDRGHSLVADDLVYAHKTGDTDVIGEGKELNRGYMECRGLGIINIAELFGVRSVRTRKRIDLIVRFVEWSPGMVEDRTGLESNTGTILETDIPLVEIPVKPGRDMARLTEVAALVQAQKAMGHNSAAAFNERLIAHMQKG